ncbi:hypothetical protein AcV5_003517 [Taiwanofungus camphoratus]|nr:hypothetical protein AcV5_003517 [Antrodia cinnamomea]
MAAVDAGHGSPEQLALQAKLKTLADLNNRLQKLRELPVHLTRLPTPGVSSSLHSATPSSWLRNELKELKEVAETLRSKKVQEALIYARDSEQKDKTGLRSNRPPESRKRRRPPSPEFPQPYRAFQSKTASLFPSLDDGLPPIRLEGLPLFIREYNKLRQNINLHVWTPAREHTLTLPIVLRFIIRDVVTVFLTLSHGIDDLTLVVENATAFGPREQKPSHSQSDYTVFQKLSQQIAKMIQSQPQIGLRNVLDLLSSYENLFVQRCTSCERVLSAEGHVPPVARVWIEHGADAGGARWESRHATCLLR